VSAIGQCGNAGENQTPQCPGSVSTFASPVSFSNNTFTWTVSTQSNSYNGSECVLISPVFQDISTYAEECNGGTCCGGEAVSVCTHNHGTFYDCYCNWSPIIITTTTIAFG
jgi:hypothetical protein